MKKTLAILTAALMTSGVAVAAPTAFGDDATLNRTGEMPLLLAQSIADPTDPSDDDDSPDAQVLEEGADSENAGGNQTSAGQEGEEIIEDENAPEEGFGDESPESGSAPDTVD